MDFLIAKSGGFCRGVKKAVDTVCEKVTELGKNIYDWYQAHKEDIEIVLKMVYQTVSTAVTVVLAVAAVASAIAAPSPVTILAAISSVTSAVDSITGFVKQTQVTTKYFQGDKAAARELDSKSNAEYMCGSDNTAGIVIYEGIQFAGNICGMISPTGWKEQVQSVFCGIRSLEETRCCHGLPH